MRTYSINDKPISIHGLAVKENGMYYRLPLDVIDTISENVSGLARETAGARVRFRTDAEVLNIKYVPMRECLHGLAVGSLAYSMASIYIDGQYEGHLAGSSIKEGYIEWNSTGNDFEKGMHDVDIYLPLQNGIKSMEISVNDEAQVLPAKPYKYEKPIVFYGSSITQGIAASHAGVTYVNRVCRALDTEYIDLGFSGSALGEENISSYIASLNNMSIFVLDYDHNAPTPEHLEKTHEPFYRKVRNAHPDLPIVFMTRPNFRPLFKNNPLNHEIVQRTYENAVKAGDKNVYFIDGLGFSDGIKNILGKDDPGAWLDCTSDGVHPNDIGMYLMAKTVAPVLKQILEK